MARIIISVESDAGSVEVHTSDDDGFRDGLVENQVASWTQKIGERPKAIRESKGLSLRDAAAAACPVGYPVNFSFIGKLERGEKNWCLRSIVGICRAYGISPDALLLPGKTVRAR